MANPQDEAFASKASPEILKSKRVGHIGIMEKESGNFYVKGLYRGSIGVLLGLYWENNIYLYMYRLYACMCLRISTTCP